jgi:WD40 repeat protein
MSRQRAFASAARLLFFALFIAACAGPPHRPANVVTSLPIPTPSPVTGRGALSSELISEQNVARLGQLAEIGLGRLAGIALSPDGSSLAVASTTGLLLYDPASLQVARAMPTGAVDLVTFTDGGQTVVTVSGRRIVKWDITTRSVVAESDEPTSIVAMAGSEGDALAFGLAPRTSERPEGFANLHRTSDLARLRSLPDNGARINSMAQNASGTLLAVAAGNEVSIWPIDSGPPRPTLRGHSGLVTAVAWSGSDRVVTASADGTVRVWQTENGKLLQTLNTLDSALTCLAVTADGRMIAAGSSAGGIHVFDAEGKLIRSFHARPGALRQLVFTPDGEGLITAGDDQTLARWRTSDWQQLARQAGHVAGVYDIAFSPDSARLVTGAIRHGLLDLWRVSDGALLGHEEAHDGLGVNAVAFSPDGGFFVTGGEDSLVRLWSASGEPLRSLAGHTEYVATVAVAPDSATIASGSYDSTIRLWRASEGKTARVLKGHGSWVNSVAFSPDGSRLLSASYDRTARLWDTANGKEIGVVGRYETDATSVAWSPDGQTLAVGLSAGGEVRLLDAAGNPLRALPGDGSEQVTGLSFSPDGRLLAASYYQGEPVRVWRVSDGALLAVLAGPRDLFSVAFSPDGTLLAAASGQGVVALFGPQ